jgi:hypothetical protein
MKGGDGMDFDLKIMIFGLQIVLVGGFLFMMLPYTYYENISELGFLLMLVGVVIGIFGLLGQKTEPTKPPLRLCPHCGTATEEGAQYCKKCGNKLP